MSEQQSVDIVVNDSGAISGIKSVNTALGNFADTIEQSVAAVTKFNDKGEEIRKTFRAISDDGALVETNLRKQGDGYKLLNARILETIEATRKLTAQRREAEKIAFSFSKSSGDEVRKAFPAPSGNDLAALAKYETAITKIRQLVTSGKVSESEVTQFASALKGGKPLETLTSGQSQLQQTLLKAQTLSVAEATKSAVDAEKQRNAILLGLSRQRTKEQNKDATDALKQQARDAAAISKSAAFDNTKSAGDAVRKTFPVPAGADLAALARYESTIARIRQLLASGKVSQGEFQNILGAVSKGGILQNLTGGGSTLQSYLVQLQAQFDQTGGKGKTAFGVIQSAVERLETIASRLVIRTALYAFIKAIEDGIVKAAELDRKLTELKVAQGNETGIGKLGAQVRALSDATGLPQLDLVNAKIQLLQQRGASAAESQQLLATSVKLSQATFSTMEQSTNVLTQTLNAYGISNARAEQTASVLFRTSQLGHTNISDLGTAVSRVAQDAGTLGVSFEQVNGFIATMGQNGFTASQSASTLDSIFQKLLHPTTALKEVFHSLGVENGEVAISTFGFAGTLEKLIEAAHNSGSELDTELGSLKALKGVLGSSGDSFQELKKNTDDVSLAFDKFHDTADQVSQSAGQQMQKEFEKIRNFFESDLGETFVKTFKLIGDNVISFSTLIKTLSVAVATGASIWVTYKAVVLSYNTAAAISKGITELLAIAKAKTTAATVAQTAAQTAGTGATTTGAAATASATIVTNTQTAANATNAISWWGVAAAIAAATAGLSLIAGAGVAAVSFGAFNGSADVNTDDTIQRLRKQSEDQTETEQQQAEKRKAIIVQEYDDRVKSLQQYISQLKVAVQQDLDVFRAQEKTVDDVLKLAAEQSLSAFKDQASELKREASSARSEIEQSKKYVASSTNKTSEKLGQFALSHESDPALKQQILNTQLRSLRQQEVSDQSKTDKESIASTKKRFDDEAALIVQRHELEIERQKKATEDYYKANPSARPNGPIRIPVDQELQKLSRELVDLDRRRLEYNQALQESLKKQGEEARKQAVTDDLRAKRVQELVKAAADFTAFDKDGNIKKEFQGATPDESVKKILAGYEAAQKAAKDALAHPENIQILTEEQAFQQKRILLAKEARAIIDKNELEAEAKLLIEKQKLAKKAIDDAQKDIQSAKDKQKELIDQIAGDIKTLTAKGSQTLTGLLAPQAAGNFPGQVDAVNAAQSDFLKKSELAQQALREANLDKGNTEKAEKAAVATENLAAAYNKLLDVAKQLRSYQIPLIGAEHPYDRLNKIAPATEKDKATTATQLTNDLIEKAKGLQTAAGNQRTATSAYDAQLKALQATSKQLDSLQKDLTAKYPAAAATAGAAVKKSFEEAASGINTLTEAVGKLVDRLKDIKPPQLPSIPQSGNAAVFSGFGEVQGFADGGFVPRGTDTVPAMLSPGEYVWDVETTRRFYPLIRSLHEGIRPTYKSQGGAVTNIGDINVAVHGGTTTEQTARDIAYRIKREIRRGTLEN